MQPIEAIIFDWGNTLVDYPLERQAEQVAWLSAFLVQVAKQFSAPFRTELERLSASESALLEFNQELPDYAVRNFEKRLREALPMGFSSHVASVVERQLCERLFSAAKPVEGAAHVLQELCRMGFRVGVVSNTPWGTTARQWRGELDNYEFFRNHCVTAVFCGDVGFRKPHPAPLLACVHKLQSSPAKTLVVGDGLNSDIAGARAAGCIGVWFDRIQARTAGPDQPSITSLSEVLALCRPSRHAHTYHG